MKLINLPRTVLFIASLPLLAGCVVSERHPHRVVVVEPATPEVIITEPAPPPLRVEVAPACPSPAHVWIPGCWEWRGRWVWTSGRWMVRPRVNAIWVAPHWEHREHSRIWIRGGWR